MADLKKTVVANVAKTSAKRRRLMIGAAAMAGVLVIVGAVVGQRAWAHRPPKPTADPVVVARFAATPQFAQMPVEQKAPYLRSLRENMKVLVLAAESGKISRQELKETARNGFRAGARIEMSQYFALPVGPQRQAHLDRLINEQEQLRQYAARVAGGGSPQYAGNPVEMKQFIESLPPQERIQMAQFAYDMFQQRRARGLPLWPYGGETR